MPNFNVMKIESISRSFNDPALYLIFDIELESTMEMRMFKEVNEVLLRKFDQKGLSICINPIESEFYRQINTIEAVICVNITSSKGFWLLVRFLQVKKVPLKLGIRLQGDIPGCLHPFSEYKPRHTDLLFSYYSHPSPTVVTDPTQITS